MRQCNSPFIKSNKRKALQKLYLFWANDVLCPCTTNSFHYLSFLEILVKKKKGGENIWCLNDNKLATGIIIQVAMSH